jgi:hypothetical protein
MVRRRQIVAEQADERLDAIREEPRLEPSVGPTVEQSLSQQIAGTAAAKAGVDATGINVFQQQELLGRLNGRVQVQQDAGRADADLFGDARDQCREHLRVRLRLMFGQPVAVEAQAVGLFGQGDRVGHVGPVVEDAEFDGRRGALLQRHFMLSQSEGRCYSKRRIGPAVTTKRTEPPRR